MPPKAKFSKEEIVASAVEIVRTHGSDALTARALGQALGSSPRPIFTVFQSMEEVRREVRLMRDTFDSPAGGFLYAAGNGIVGGTPLENIEAYLDECLIYGNENVDC